MLVLLCLPAFIASAQDTAISLKRFSSDVDEARYHALIGELRCPKCQNQNLADSDAPIAEDLRNELHKLINQGHSDAKILEFMQMRYGNFVLYNPPLEGKTLMLWLMPLALLLLGLLVVWFVVRRNRNSSNRIQSLSDDELEQKVAAILAEQEELR